MTNASLNFFDNTHDTGGAADTLKLGNVFGGTGGAIEGLFTDIGVGSVFVDATLPTTIIDSGKGGFDIGATDASVIDAHTTAGLQMLLPDTGGGFAGFSFNSDNPFLHHGVTVTGSATGANLLQGSSGTLTLDSNGNGFIGGVANDVLTGGTGGDNIFGEGGNDTIHLGAAGHVDNVFIGMIHENGIIGTGTTFVQAITDIVGGAEIGANFTSALSTTSRPLPGLPSVRGETS